jgi:hypothetical protein
MNLNKLITSKFLKQSDIDAPTIVTIKEITVENVAPDNQAPEQKGIMYFEEFDKGLVLGKTNLVRAQSAFGGSEEMDDWIGKKIVLYVDEDVEYKGKVTGGLRLRAAKVQKPKGKSMEDANKELRDMEDDVPF